MDKFWTFLTALHSGAGPIVMLLYPLYASVIAMESTTKVDDEQFKKHGVLRSTHSKPTKPNILHSIFPHREGHEAHSH
uniref:AT4G24960 protein n=1 Tax=Arabidopsis thaliana TaxID=3702 RepID=C0Z2I7_ARATH|nr:AT4G24960 [Arabidopsis thaliana]